MSVSEAEWDRVGNLRKHTDSSSNRFEVGGNGGSCHRPLHWADVSDDGGGLRREVVGRGRSAWTLVQRGVMGGVGEDRVGRMKGLGKVSGDVQEEQGQGER